MGNEYLRLVRAEDYEAEEAASAIALNESYLRDKAVREAYDKMRLPIVKLENKLDFMKQIVSECVSDLYIKSLIVDIDDDNKKNLHDICFESCMDAMKDCTTADELYEFTSKCSPLIKSAFVLAEAATEEKEVKFDEKELIGEDELKLINDFNETENTDSVVDALAQRVFSVYETEKEIGEAEKEKIQAIATSLATVDASEDESEVANDVVAESVGGAINLFDASPKSIFSAIYLNKSRAILNENSNLDTHEAAETIITETVCTYTLLECISSLGLKTFSDEDKRALRVQFHIG